MIRECAHEACRKPFEAKRADARFCGAGCRAAASRARRAAGGVEVATGRSETGPDDVRLRGLEERVMDLAGDVEAAEAERDGLRALRGRLESAVTRAVTVEEVRGIAEAAAKAAVAPVRKELEKVRAGAVTREEVAGLLEAVERVERRLAAMEERIEAEPMPEERLSEVEKAVITLARRVGRLRGEFDVLVRALGA